MCVTVWVLRYKNKKSGDRGTIVFTATLTIPSNIHPSVVANPAVRGLLDRKRSEEHLQSSNESKKNTSKQNKKDKKKGTDNFPPLDWGMLRRSRRVLIFL